MQVRGILIASAVLVMGLAATGKVPAQQAAYTARVRVTDHVLNTVSPMVFGDNIEWVHTGWGSGGPKRAVLTNRWSGR